MGAMYMVNISNVQMYFDKNFKRCSAPNVLSTGDFQVVYFALANPAVGCLMRSAWDEPLAGFSERDRCAALLWTRLEDDT